MDFITPEEKAQLEARLNQLKANRPVISERIAEARALGDLKENAEYHAAREDQGLEEAEIRRLEARMGDGSEASDDMLGKLLGAGKRALTGESDADVLQMLKESDMPLLEKPVSPHELRLTLSLFRTAID